MPSLSDPHLTTPAKFFPIVTTKPATLPSVGTPTSPSGTRSTWVKPQSDAPSTPTSGSKPLWTKTPSEEGGSQLIPRAAWTKPQVDSSLITGQAPAQRPSWIKSEQDTSAPGTPSGKTWVKPSGDGVTPPSPLKAHNLFSAAENADSTPTGNSLGVDFPAPVAGNVSSDSTTSWAKPLTDDSIDVETPAHTNVVTSDLPTNAQFDSASLGAGALPIDEAGQMPSQLSTLEALDKNTKVGFAGAPLTIITKEDEVVVKEEEKKECESPTKTTNSQTGLQDVNTINDAKAAAKKEALKKSPLTKVQGKKPPAKRASCCTTM